MTWIWTASHGDLLQFWLPLPVLFWWFSPVISQPCPTHKVVSMIMRALMIFSVVTTFITWFKHGLQWFKLLCDNLIPLSPWVPVHIIRQVLPTVPYCGWSVIAVLSSQPCIQPISDLPHQDPLPTVQSFASWATFSVYLKFLDSASTRRPPHGKVLPSGWMLYMFSRLYSLWKWHVILILLIRNFSSSSKFLWKFFNVHLLHIPPEGSCWRIHQLTSSYDHWMTSKAN